MKKLLLALSLLATGAAHAQITPEARYHANVYLAKLSTGDLKYGGYFPATNKFHIYNANHSLYKQVSLPVGLTYGNNDDNPILSDKLFNTNAADLEFIIVGQTSTGSQLRVLSETGAIVLSIDSCSSAAAYATPVGAKLRASVYRPGSNGVGFSDTRIFSLPGTYTPLALKETLSENGVVASPYPNPSSGTVQLPYQVKAGQTATLSVSDAAGRAVATYQVDSTFDHLLLDTHTLAPGIYFYRVGSGVAQRFAVQ